MKTIVALFFLYANHAYAQNKLSDLTFFPTVGENIAVGGFSTQSVDYQVSKNNSSSEFESTTSTLGLIYIHGLAEDLALKGNLSYGRSVVESTSLSNDYVSKGLEQPEFGLSYRALNSATLIWDLDVSLAPKIFDAKSSSGTKDGTFASDSTELELETSVGRETGKFGLKATASARHYFEGKSTDQSDGSKDNQDSYTSVGLGGQLQYKVNERTSFEGGAAMTFIPSITIKNSTGTQLSYESRTVYQMNGGVNFNIDESTLIAARVVIQSVSDSDLESSTTGRNVLSYDTSTALQFLGAYRF